MTSLSLLASTRRLPGRLAQAVTPLAGHLALALVLALASVALVSGAGQAADSMASAPAVVLGGDPRSDGSGPGLVGAPLLALGAVVALGLCTVLLTALLARFTRRP